MGKEQLRMALQVLFREQCDRIHSSEYQRLYLHTGGPQLRTKGNGKVIESETERHLGLRLRATQQCVSQCALGPARLALALIIVSTDTIRKLSAQTQRHLRHGKGTIVSQASTSTLLSPQPLSFDGGMLPTPTSPQQYPDLCEASHVCPSGEALDSSTVNSVVGQHQVRSEFFAPIQIATGWCLAVRSL